MAQPDLLTYLAELPAPIPDPDGATFDAELDRARLGDQAQRVWAVMRDGEWRTLAELAAAAQAPEASVSARLRDFRKPAWGGQKVERRRRGEATRGLYEYRLLANTQATVVDRAKDEA